MKALQVNATWKPREGYIPSAREEKDKRADRGNLIFYDPVLELIQKPVPTPKDDEVLVKVGGAGVCGSDTMFLGRDKDGYTHYANHCRFPCVIGHEFSGEVVETGRKVKYLRPGDIVTAENMNWCGECLPCRMGMFNQCEDLEEIGFSLDGGFAEYLVVKEKYCSNINELVNIYGTKESAMKVGALAEPTSVAYNGLFVRAGGFMPGDNVAIFGCGPIGLAAIALAKASGAAKLIAFDLFEPRLELAKKMGADYVLNPKKLQEDGMTPSKAIIDITNGEGASLLAEATENQNATIPEMEKAMFVGGKIVQIGISSGRTLITSINFQKKGASYYGTNGNAGHGIFLRATRLMASGRIDMSKIINKCYSLDNAIEAIKDAKSGTPGKNVVTPNF